MSYQYPPPPPPGYGPPQQQQMPAMQQPQGYAQQPQQPPQQQNASGWVDNRTIIGGWHAAQFGMQPGKHIEYKVYSKPTSKGGVFKGVEFFKPYQKKNGTMGEGREFSFNQMKELVEKINHFINNYSDDKGFFVWQPAGFAQGQGQPAGNYPPPQQQGYAQQPQYGPPPQQQGYGAPPPPPQYGPPPGQYPPPQQPPQPQQGGYPPPPPPQRDPWP